VDGWRYHAEGTFVQDHDVPNDLVADKDYVVLRFSGRDVQHRLEWVLDQIGWCCGGEPAAWARRTSPDLRDRSRSVCKPAK